MNESWRPKPKPKEEPEMIDPKGMVVLLFTRWKNRKPKPENPPEPSK